MLCGGVFAAFGLTTKRASFRRRIAAIAASHDFAVASRDASAFMAAGLTVIDPWTE